MAKPEPIPHHKGLVHEELRKLVAEAARDQGMWIHITEREPLRETLVQQFDRARRALASFDKGTGFRAILEGQGWEPHDVSDYVSPYDIATYTDFVGTASELKAAYPDYPLGH